MFLGQIGGRGAGARSRRTRPSGVFSLKVMSFNIRYSNTTDQGEKSWSQRRKPCVDMIKDVNPGVIGMQESRTEQRNYLKAMLTKYELLEVPNTGTGSGGNSTVLYRTDLFTRVDWGYFYLSDTPEKPSAPWDATNSARRSSVWVHLKDNASGREFVFLSTHFPESNTSAADNEARLKCAQLNVNKMKEIAGTLPVFIVGDMNCSYAADDTRRSALAPYYAWMQSAGRRLPTGTALTVITISAAARRRPGGISTIYFTRALSRSVFRRSLRRITVWLIFRITIRSRSRSNNHRSPGKRFRSCRNMR